VKSPCWKCGTNLLAADQFCGKCGAPRARDEERGSLQSKLASAWRAHQTARQDSAAAPTNGAPPSPETTQAASSYPNPDDNEAAIGQEAAAEEENVEAPSAALVKSHPGDVVWSSAAKARDFLESLSAPRTPGALARFWRSRRGDFYLVLALILVVVVIRWGIWSDQSVVATGRGTTGSGAATRSKRPAPDADLSAFDKLLIGLGLAEAPDEAPQYKGNPDTQVWVDLHTALYYCPGSDLYGKTPQGKLSSQRDAQLDQFEPANRKACQ
jgi:hypothetical protein